MGWIRIRMDPEIWKFRAGSGINHFGLPWFGFWNTCFIHKVRTSREEKGGRRTILLSNWTYCNWPLPYSGVPVPLFRDAMPAGWVNCFSLCASTMPRSQNRAAKGSILQEDEILFHYGYIIYLWSHRWAANSKEKNYFVITYHLAFF